MENTAFVAAVPYPGKAIKIFHKGLVMKFSRLLLLERKKEKKRKKKKEGGGGFIIFIMVETVQC